MRPDVYAVHARMIALNTSELVSPKRQLLAVTGLAEELGKADEAGSEVFRLERGGWSRSWRQILTSWVNTMGVTTGRNNELP